MASGRWDPVSPWVGLTSGSWDPADSPAPGFSVDPGSWDPEPLVEELLSSCGGGGGWVWTLNDQHHTYDFRGSRNVER
jgi:hypothetical protein